MVKDRSRVSFGMNLDIGRFCEKGQGEEALKYQLSGVVEHMGGEGSGHYVTYKRMRENERWLYCSDETVREIDEHVVRGREAFLLLYERMCVK